MAFEKPTQAQLENRFLHRPPKGDQAERYETLRRQMLNTATLCVSLTPPSPEQTRALNQLDHALVLFIAAIARGEP